MRPNYCFMENASLHQGKGCRGLCEPLRAKRHRLGRSTDFRTRLCGSRIQKADVAFGRGTTHRLEHSTWSGTVFSLLALAALIIVNSTDAQGTAFTYQGRLSANGAAANGLYDLQFML